MFHTALDPATTHPSTEGAPMKLDEQRALLATGDGVVARMPGIVLVAVPATGNEARVGELIALCREIGEASPEAPGRTLARRMAGLLSSADPDTGSRARASSRRPRTACR